MKKKYLLGPSLIIIAAFLWSLDSFLRQALYSLPSSLVVFLEHILGFLITLPILVKFWPTVRKLSRDTWFSVWWVVIFGGVLGTIFYTKALSLVNYIDLSVVVLLQKLQPVFAVALAMVVLKEKVNKNYWWYAGLALVGGYLVTFKNLLPSWDTGQGTLGAALLAVGAAFAWGSSTVFGRKALLKVDYKLLTSLRFGLTALVLLPFIFYFQGVIALPQVTGGQWLKLAAIVFSTGLVAVFIYYAGLKSTKASVATFAEMFWPVSAVLLDYFINGTILTSTQLIGALLLLISIYKLSSNQLVSTF